MSFGITDGGRIVPSHRDDSVYRALVRTLTAWVRIGQRREVWDLVCEALYGRVLVDVREEVLDGDQRVVTLTLGGPAVRR